MAPTAQATPPPSATSKTTLAPPSISSNSILSRIHKPSGDLKRLSACIYSKTGVGKTTLLRTMPGNGLLIDVPQIEGGTNVLTGHDNIDVLPVMTWDEIQEAYEHLKSGKHEYQWVALDTITALQVLAKRKAIRERDLTADPHSITQQDWGKIGDLMKELFYTFRLLPMHFIALAQEAYRDNDEKVREYRPAVSPSALEGLTMPLNLIGRLFMYETGDGVWERRLRVGPHANYVTKCRAIEGRDIGPVVRDPNLGQIFAYLMGHNIAKPEEAVDDTGMIMLA